MLYGSLCYRCMGCFRAPAFSLPAPFDAKKYPDKFCRDILYQRVCLLFRRCFLYVDTLFFQFAALHVVSDRCCDKQGGKRTDDDTYNHGKYEAAQRIGTDEEDDNQYYQRTRRCVQRTRQGAVEGVVDNLAAITFGVELHHLADAVEYHHRIVDGVTYHSKDSRDEGLVYLHREGQYAVEYRVETYDDKCCECQ